MNVDLKHAARVAEVGDVPLEMVSTETPTDRSIRDVTSLPQEPRLARHVAAQLVEAARILPDRPVELTLNPDELGKVRMTLSANEGAISVSLLAERAETADLLRRHIETLSEEFRALGYSDISFSFGGDGSHGDAERQRPSDTLSDSVAIPGEDVAENAPMIVDLDGRVDIRL